MKKIVPFRKDIHFKTKISEITSISLEHSLKIDDSNYIAGEFVVSGDYRITKVSINKEMFSYNLPFDIHLDIIYNLNNVKIDIDDFYYEIINDEILRVSIDVLIDGLEVANMEEGNENLEEKQQEEILDIDDNEESEENIMNNIEKEEVRDDLFKQEEEPAIPVNVEVNKESTKEVEDKIKSIFDSFNEKDETFTSYHIHIVRKEDNIESIMAKYEVSKEELEMYNNLEEIKLGDKIIIPASNNE